VRQELVASLPTDASLSAKSSFSGSETRQSRLPLYSCVQVSIIFLFSLDTGHAWLSGNAVVRIRKADKAGALNVPSYLDNWKAVELQTKGPSYFNLQAGPLTSD
jgi:hypothetical protein